MFFELTLPLVMQNSYPAFVQFLASSNGNIAQSVVGDPKIATTAARVDGRPEGWRPRPRPDPPPHDRPDWIEGSFRFDSYERALRELLSLGPDIEILLPVELRDAMRGVADRLARRHGTSRHP